MELIQLQLWWIIKSGERKKHIKKTSFVKDIYEFFFPNEKYDLLYDDITPVNSFRIVFDSHFQTNYGILEDNVFFSTYEKPYTLIEITDFSIFRWLYLPLIKPDLVA